MEAYIAVKLDMKGSRHMADRAGVQARLFDAIDGVNAGFAAALCSEFIVTHGDEAQGLVKRAAGPELIGLLEYMIDRMKPVVLRWGIGYGEISTPVRPVSIGMDGQAWYLASDAIEAARRRGQYVEFRGFREGLDMPMSAMLNLSLFLRYRWTPQQTRAIQLLESGHSQVSAANHLGVSPPSVSKTLRTAGWPFYRNAISTLENMISQACSG